MCRARGRCCRRGHGCTNPRTLFPGEVWWGLYGRDPSKFHRLLGAAEEVLTITMIYPIVKFGDPVLEKPAAQVTAFDDDLKKLVEDMFESMYAAHGVGLAAPQIGISK